MNRGVLATAGLVLPPILLHRLWSGRRRSILSETIEDASPEKGSSSLPLPIGEYEVFLNFRGPDTRRQITDILYRFLVNLKIRTFKDNEEFRKGEAFPPRLAKAIEQSKIFVAIFSENYAHSKWCLGELAAFVERKEQEKGCIILPIFYLVDPRDVRCQTGPFEKAFQQHEKKFDEKTRQVWKDAMAKVGALEGWHIKSNDEQGATADLITGNVWSHLSKTYSVIETDHLIGIDHHTEAIKERMTLDSGGVTIVGIHGIGGIGKTTIAKAVYDKVAAQFDRCSFVENIRARLQQKDGVVNLQKHIISDIMRTRYADSIVNIGEGMRILKDRISCFKFLIVLDDVDEEFGFSEIFGKIEHNVSGSRFIVTSRDVKVLGTLTEESKLYRVREMNHAHALQLFSKYAFRKDSPPSSHETLSKDIVAVAAGLPLTVKVVGSLLFREEKYIWEEKLKQLKRTPEEKVAERLKISYDALNDEAKEIFLDIACFFIEMETKFPSYMWSDCSFFPTININILIQRSMIDIGEDNKFKMHDQLRDMGREIVRKENTKHPWKRSRIWSKQIALDMLRNRKGTNLVEGIRLNEFAEELGKECFMNLSELRYLDAKVKSLTGDCSMYLPNLRWLQLKIRTGEVLPKFSMENLVVLELLSPMKDDCGSLMHIKMANKLKVLKVFGHYGLTAFPEFPQSQSLEILHLLYFGSMSSPKDLDIGNLRNLNELQLRSCKVRKIRGGTIGMLKGLRVLEFRDFYCRKNLREVLADIGVLQFLEILRVDVKNGGAEYLFPWRNLLLGIKLPTSLKVLRTSSPVANLPELLDLEEMTVEDCDTFGLELPPADGDSNMWWKLSKLKSLKIKRTKLSLPTRLLLPSSLTTLHILECQELDWLPSLENLENLTQLVISSCPLIKEIPGLGSLLSLTKLSLVGCKALERLPSLASLSKLDELFTSACPLIVEIQGLEGLKSLQHLTIDSADNLTHLLGFGNLLFFNKLETITITNCPLLTSLSFHDLDDGDDGCGDCQLPAVLCSLRYLSISGTMLVLDILCQMLQLAQFPSLLTFSLKVMGIDNVDVELPLEWIGSMEKLAELTLSGLVSVWKLPFLSKLRNLKKLTIAGAPNLQEVEELAGLKSLEHLKLTGCTSLQRLPADDLSGLKQLQSIDISDCANLADQFTPRKTNLTALIR
ncbi:unnamed protein product [Linum tenue]|uniref:TIR domain-containing protein n=1 Tax=Linum tenue TaxID=586396 RepID=A0AAV0JWF6_9ROSI|nr:unnamed protein product [Linum tenue]